MVVVMQGSNAVGANGTNENVVSGQRYERAPYYGLGSLYCTGSAAGLTVELNVGGVSITPPTGVNTQNRFPVVPDDSLVSGWEFAPGQLLQLRVVNTTGGALTFFWRVELNEVQVQ